LRKEGGREGGKVDGVGHDRVVVNAVVSAILVERWGDEGWIWWVGSVGYMTAGESGIAFPIFRLKVFVVLGG